jgi:adenylate kinase
VNILIVGPQGSGKTTQARLLAEKLRIPHLQTGKMCRDISLENSKLGRRVRKCLSETGELVPDREMMMIAGQEFVRQKYKNGVVLDGIPRNVWQAKNLELRIDKVFYLKVRDVVGIKRLMKRAREDDTLQLIAGRLRDYHQRTKPMLDFYRKRGILEEINGERSIKVIFKDILERLESEDYSQERKGN